MAEAASVRNGLKSGENAFEAIRKDKESLEKTSLVLGEERRVLELVAHGASLPEIFVTLTQAVERVAPAGCMCSILLVDSERGCLVQGAAPSLPAGFWELCQNIPILPDLGCCSSAAFRNEVTIAEDIATDHRWAPIRDKALGFGLRACWSAPIRDSKDAVLGTFAMYHPAPAKPAELELQMVEAGAQLAGRAIERVKAHQNLIEQVRAKEQALVDLAGAQERLMSLSRQAGMAQVAVGVLHNVGNALNSVNVSASLVQEKIRESRADNLHSLVTMLEENRGRLDDYLACDPKGSRVLPYLSKLSSHLSDERRSMLAELESLNGSISHIREIVATQQSHASVSGLKEEVSLEALIEDAFRMIHPGFERHEIEVRREFAGLPKIVADKHRILQILLNLLNNAKRAITGTTGTERMLTVRTRSIGASGADSASGHMLAIEVIDTGVGIDPENLTRIFAQGFTTRSDGHGFGLHSAALTAREMGGALRVESEGLGRGATFVLELPNEPAGSDIDTSGKVRDRGEGDLTAQTPEMRAA